MFREVTDIQTAQVLLPVPALENEKAAVTNARVTARHVHRPALSPHDRDRSASFRSRSSRTDFKACASVWSSAARRFTVGSAALCAQLGPPFRSRLPTSGPKRANQKLT